MRESIGDLSDNEKKFLLALIEDGSRTDADIADETGMSTATANRIRRRFEEDGTLKEYLPIVALEQVGIELYATLTVEGAEDVDAAEVASHPNIIFLGETEDFRRTLVIFAGFAGFDEYHTFLEDFKDTYREEVDNVEANVIAPQNIVKEDFTHIIKHNLRTALEGDDEA